MSSSRSGRSGGSGRTNPVASGSDSHLYTTPQDRHHRQPQPSGTASQAAHRRAHDSMDDQDDDDDDEYNPEYEEDSDIAGEAPATFSDEYEYDDDEDDDDDELHDDQAESVSTGQATGGASGAPAGDDTVTGVLPCPPHLRDISSHPSWTVSSFKPGCSVAELRSANTNLFWQSDGPQPHTLNIHFSKMVEIVAIRIYLNFDQDESYTPSKIEWLAGTGYNDLVAWEVQHLKSPKGWIWVNMSAVDDGFTRRNRVRRPEPFNPFSEYPPGHNIDSDSDEEDPDIRTSSSSTTRASNNATNIDDLDGDGFSASDLSDTDRQLRRRRKPLYPVLRCMLLQMRILENHENGKDTHIRGLQFFARKSRKQHQQAKKKAATDAASSAAAASLFVAATVGVPGPDGRQQGPPLPGVFSGSLLSHMLAGRSRSELPAQLDPLGRKGHSGKPAEPSEPVQDKSDWLQMPDIR